MRPIRAIAAITFHEIRKQPTTRLITLIAGLLMLLLPVVSLYALGSEGVLLKEMGLSTIGLATILIALLGAVNTITREIEGRTILMLLAKPVSRAQVIIGKYAGLMMTVVSVGVLLTFLLMVSVVVQHATGGPRGSAMWSAASRAWLDARTGTQPGATPDDGAEGSIDVGGATHAQTAPAAPRKFVDPLTVDGQSDRIAYCVRRVIDQDLGIVLLGAYMMLWSTAIVGAVLVAGSTVLPVAANAVLAMAVFTLGNLMDIIDVALNGAPPVQAVVRVVIPDLRLFEISDLLSREGPLPMHLAVDGTLVGVAYCAALLAVGCLLFERRDVG